jgi:hypothetical protein
MTTTKGDRGLSLEEIKSVEDYLSLEFPISLREHFTRSNGGTPDPDCYESPTDPDVGVIISSCYPLRHGKGSAVNLYEELVLKKGLVPKTFFPVANDPGGDILFVDCATHEGLVYLWHHDTAFDPVVPFHIGLAQFWDSLQPS